jgi:tetratricopeptide (TPR) repeat protein
MSVDPAHARVQALINLGRLKEAAAEARLALARDPNDAHTWALLAASLIDSGDPAGGLEAATTRVRLEPAGANGHRLRAIALNRLKRHGDAVEAITEAIRLEPNSPSSHRVLVDAHIAQATGRLKAPAVRGHIEQARQAAEMSIKLAPGSAASHASAANVEILDRKPAAARAHANAALAIDPQHATAHLMLGLVAKAEGNITEASDHFVRAGKISPSTDTTKLLKGLTTVGTPALGAVVYAIVRTTSLGSGKSLPNWMAGLSDQVYLIAAIVIAIVLAALFALGLQRQPKASKRLSPEAERILKADAATRKRWRWRS